MRKRNRAYKKGLPFRDARLFVIVAEGEREDTYFRHFEKSSRRIKILLIPRESDASSPNLFLDRLAKAEDSVGYEPKEGDRVWFVCDVDRWQKHLPPLIQHCINHAGQDHRIAISNPCFEIWLHYHSGPVNSNTVSCKQLKSTLPQTAVGEYIIEKYHTQIQQAIQFASAADTDPTNDMPGPMQTKLYRLAQELNELIEKEKRA
jgi:hypothetical protein